MGRGETRAYAASSSTVNLDQCRGFARIEKSDTDIGCARPLPTPADASCQTGGIRRVAASSGGDIVWVHQAGRLCLMHHKLFKRAHTGSDTTGTPQAIAFDSGVSPNPSKRSARHKDPSTRRKSANTPTGTSAGKGAIRVREQALGRAVFQAFLGSFRYSRSRAHHRATTFGMDRSGRAGMARQRAISATFARGNGHSMPTASHSPALKLGAQGGAVGAMGAKPSAVDAMHDHMAGVFQIGVVRSEVRKPRYPSPDQPAPSGRSARVGCRGEHQPEPFATSRLAQRPARSAISLRYGPGAFARPANQRLMASAATW